MVATAITSIGVSVVALTILYERLRPLAREAFGAEDEPESHADSERNIEDGDGLPHPPMPPPSQEGLENGMMNVVLRALTPKHRSPVGSTRPPVVFTRDAMDEEKGVGVDPQVAWEKLDLVDRVKNAFMADRSPQPHPSDGPPPTPVGQSYAVASIASTTLKITRGAKILDLQVDPVGSFAATVRLILVLFLTLRFTRLISRYSRTESGNFVTTIIGLTEVRHCIVLKDC